MELWILPSDEALLRCIFLMTVARGIVIRLEAIGICAF